MRRILLILMICGLTSAASGADTRDPNLYFFNPNAGDLKAELADAKSAGKKALFLMFEQEGCPGCLHMKEHVLNRPEVQAFYREHFVNLSIDIFGSVPIADLSGRGLTEKSYAQSVHVKGTPTLLFYDLAGNEILRILGPAKDAQEFLLLGEFVVSGAYKSRKFADFRQSRLKNGS